MIRKKEIEKRMDELKREYRETRNEKIIDELSQVARELEKIEKEEEQ